MPRSATPTSRKKSSSRTTTGSREELLDGASPKAKTLNKSIADIPAPAGEANQGVSASLQAIMIFWVGIVLYSVLVSKFVPGDIRWYEMILHYLAAMAAFYAWHWQAHRCISWIPFNSGCRKMHMEHHWKIYPPEHYFGKDPDTEDQLIRTHSSFVTAHEALLYVGLVVVLGIARFVFNESYGALAAALVLDAFIGFTGNWLHERFHIKGHWLERFAAFHELRAVHYVHHLGTTKMNYAVFNIGLDYLMGSLLLEKPKRTAVEERAQIAELSSRVGGLASLTFGLQFVPRKEVHQTAAVERGWVPVLFRALVVSLLLWAWFGVEQWLAACAPVVGSPTTKQGDFLFKVVPEVSTPEAADALLSLYNVLIDAIGVVLLAKCVFGHSIRPLFSLFYAMFLREVIQIIGWHASPAGSHWTDAQTYSSVLCSHENTANALCGGILLLCIFMAELKFLPRALWVIVGLALAGTQVYCLAALRAEHTADIFISFIVGRYVCVVSSVHAPTWEGFLP